MSVATTVVQAVRHPRKVFYGWWMALSGLGTSAYTDGVGFYGFSGFFKAILDEFGWSQAVTAIAPSLQRLESGILAPLNGFLVDRWGARKMLLLGFFSSGLACILLSRIQNLWQYYGVFILFSFGLSAGSFFVTSAALNHWFRRYRGRAIGLMMLGPGLSGLLAGLWVWIIPMFGWRAVLFAAGLGFWVFCMPLALVIRDRPEPYGQEPDGGPGPVAAKTTEKSQAADVNYPLSVILRSRGYWQFVLTSSLMGASWAVLTFAVAALQSFGLAVAAIAFLMVWVTISSIPARLLSGVLADIFDKRLVLAGAITLQLMAVLLVAATTTFWMAFLAFFLLGSSIGGQSPIRLALQAEYWGRSVYGRVSGIQQGISAAPAILAPIFVGWMYDTNDSYRLAFVLVALPLLLAIPLTLTIRPPAVMPVPAGTHR